MDPQGLQDNPTARCFRPGEAPGPTPWRRWAIGNLCCTLGLHDGNTWEANSGVGKFMTHDKDPLKEAGECLPTLWGAKRRANVRLVLGSKTVDGLPQPDHNHQKFEKKNMRPCSSTKLTRHCGGTAVVSKSLDGESPAGMDV